MGSEPIYYDPTLPIQSGSYQAIYRTGAANDSMIEFSDPATAESDFANAEFVQIHAGNTSQNSAGCVVGSELANITLNKLFSFLAGCQLRSTTQNVTNYISTNSAYITGNAEGNLSFGLSSISNNVLKL
jgi:hypothetical protein